MLTRGNLRKQYDRAPKDDPTLPQLYRNRGSTTRSLVVREHGVLNMPETNIEIYHFLRNRHFGATSIPMKPPGAHHGQGSEKTAQSGPWVPPPNRIA
jgi:hypothetical protein